MRRYVGGDLPALLRGPVLRYETVVDAWRDGVLELGGVPITGGRVRWTSALVERAEVSLSVPATAELTPDGPYHPLAPYGQEVAISARVEGPNGAPVVPLGRFRITTPPERSGDTLELGARDLGVNIERARLVSPTAYGPLTSTSPDAGRRGHMNDLLANVLPVFYEAPDAPLGAILTPLRDRLAALEEMLEAWGAVATFDPSGALVVRQAPDPARPLALTLTDGADGTVVAVDLNPAPATDYNACVAQGTDAAGGTVWGGAYVTSGPMAWPNTDPASQYGMNPGFYASPLLRTPNQCADAARTILDRWQRGANGTVAVEAGPDPRLEVGDKVRVVKGGRAYDAELTTVELPLTAADGPMRLEGAIL